MTVIPGRERARNPYAAALRIMDSGLVRLRAPRFGGRPGMTPYGFFALNTTKCESEKFTTKLTAIETSFAPTSGIT
jgi:hypothetical protein